MPLHELFDSLTDAVRDHADEIAEHAAALGGIAAGRKQDVAGASILAEYPTDVKKGQIRLSPLTRPALLAGERR